MKLPHMLTGRIVKVLVIGALLVISLVVLIQKIKNEDMADQKSYHDICNKDSIGEELKNNYSGFGAERAVEMEDIKSRIISEPNNLQSVNCLFVLGKYYSYTGQYSKSVEAFDTLLQIAKEQNVWLDQSISSETIQDIEDLKQFLISQQSQLKNTREHIRVPSLEID